MELYSPRGVCDGSQCVGAALDGGKGCQGRFVIKEGLRILLSFGGGFGNLEDTMKGEWMKNNSDSLGPR